MDDVTPPKQDVAPVIAETKNTETKPDVAPQPAMPTKEKQQQEVEAAIETDKEKTIETAGTGVLKKSSASPAIIIAVIVAMLLIGLGYAAVLFSGDDVIPDNTETNNASSQEEVPVSNSVSPADEASAAEEAAALEQLITELEAIVDVTDESISDEELGL